MCINPPVEHEFNNQSSELKGHVLECSIWRDISFEGEYVWRLRVQWDTVRGKCGWVITWVYRVMIVNHVHAVVQIRSISNRLEDAVNAMIQSSNRWKKITRIWRDYSKHRMILEKQGSSIRSTRIHRMFHLLSPGRRSQGPNQVLKNRPRIPIKQHPPEEEPVREKHPCQISKRLQQRGERQNPHLLRNTQPLHPTMIPWPDLRQSRAIHRIIPPISIIPICIIWSKHPTLPSIRNLNLKRPKSRK